MISPVRVGGFAVELVARSAPSRPRRAVFG
jgi:hypothetical protein